MCVGPGIEVREVADMVARSVVPELDPCDDLRHIGEWWLKK